MTTNNKSVPRFRFGDWVAFTLGAMQVVAKIIEDRGPIGARGRRLYQVEMPIEDGNADRFEMPEESMRKILTSFDLTRAEGRASVMRFLAEADCALRKYVNTLIEVVHFVAHESLETGQKDRFVIQLKNGTTVDTQSESFGRTFLWVAHEVGLGPWDPPIIFHVRARKGRREFDYYSCVEILRNNDGSVPALE